MFTVLMVIGMIVPGPLVDGAPAPLDVRPAFSCSRAAEAQRVSVANVICATGTGYPPPRMKGVRAKLMARRAAEVVAVRNLATKLGYGRRATIRGFRYAATTYHADGSVEVVVEYPADHRASAGRGMVCQGAAR